jgi:ribonuclease D
MARWVADRSALNDTLAALRDQRRLALDTEFERIRTYWPKLALVQAMLPDRRGPGRSARVRRAA